MASRWLGLTAVLLLSSPAGAADEGDVAAGKDESAPLGGAAVEEEELPRTRFGIGVGLDLIGGTTTGTNFRLDGLPDSEILLAVPRISFLSLQVPIWIGEHVRIEPEIGFGRTTRTLGWIDDFEGEGTSLTAASQSFLFGSSVAWAFGVAPSTRAYVGPRIGIILRRDEQEFRGEGARESLTVTSSDLFLGALIGGESFLTSHFSLGVEGELFWISEGKPKVEVKPAVEAVAIPVDMDGSQVSSRVRLFGRLYFL